MQHSPFSQGGGDGGESLSTHSAHVGVVVRSEGTVRKKGSSGVPEGTWVS